TAQELDRLTEIGRGLSEEDKRRIIQLTRKLKEEQEAKQDLSSLPTLELADVPMSFEAIPNRLESVAGTEIGMFPQPTNAITYVDLRIGFERLSEPLVDLLPLFSYCFPKMGAGKDDYLKMANRISFYTGGISASAGVRPHASGTEILRNWTLQGKALARNHEQFVAILKDFLEAVRFEPKRLHELIAELRIAKEASVVGSGTHYASVLAGSRLSAEGALDERLGGLSQLALLKELARLGVDELEDIIDKFTSITEELFRSDGLKVCITTEDRYLAEVQGLLAPLINGLPGEDLAGLQEAEFSAGPFVHQARTTSCPVAFNARVFKTVRFTHPDAPALLALSHFLRASYLHREIREKGGAYGAHANYDSEKGKFTFSSYRDPNISRTYDVFEEAVSFVLKGGLDRDEIKEAILSAAGAVDPLESPDTKGRRRFFDNIAGYTLDLRQEYKRGLLRITEDDLVRVADTYLAHD
ncbi:MAG: insulinase family protein, partial [Actinomycetota bacterium]